MTTKPDGGPAYPGFQDVPGYGCSRPIIGPQGDVVFENYAPGMTLRDWFAGMALQALDPAPFESGKGFSNDARIAYAMADALIEARSK